MQYFSAIRIGLFLTIGFALQGPVLADTEYPAAYFEPYIVYQAPEIAGNAAAGSQTNATETASEPEAEDPYPAAYFQPVIVYQNQEWIAARTEQPAAEPEPAPVEQPAAIFKKTESSAATSAPIPASDRGGVPVGVIVLLVAIAGGLYWVMFKKKGETEQAAPAETNGSASPSEASSDETSEPEDQGEQPPDGS